MGVRHVKPTPKGKGVRNNGTSKSNSNDDDCQDEQRG